jgi:hypothetical protein
MENCLLRGHAWDWALEMKLPQEQYYYKNTNFLFIFNYILGLN